MKKSRMQNLFIISISLILIGINTVVLSKNSYIEKRKLNSQIAKAIIDVEKDELLEKEIEEKTFPIEYYFSINNYKEELINEVDFDYVIELSASNENFPIQYTLFDCNHNREISLSDGKSESLRLNKNIKESRKFKLTIHWKEFEGEWTDDVEIKLKVDAIQSKKGEVYEDSKDTNIMYDNFNIVY